MLVESDLSVLAPKKWTQVCLFFLADLLLRYKRNVALRSRSPERRSAPFDAITRLTRSPVTEKSAVSLGSSLPTRRHSRA